MGAALVALLVLALAPVARSDDARPMIVRVSVDSAADAAFLMTHFDETHNHGNGEIELLLWPGDRAELDALGFDYRVTVEDLFAQDVAANAGPKEMLKLPGPDREDYRRLADYNTEMQDLAKKNPDLVKSFEMKRPTLEGRPVYGVEIAANVKADDGRPIFYIDALHHAREWPSSEYTMLYIHHLVESFGKDPKITSLLKKARVIAVPIVNVDGFNYSRESVFSFNQALSDATGDMASGNGFEGYWRKNRRSLTGVTVPGAQVNPDSYGVDPNRNYSYLWGDSNGGSSGTLVDQTYRGDAPFSEPETQNVRDIILGRSVTGVLTNHTYQASVLRTGGGKAPDDLVLERIGQKVADILHYKNQATVGYPTTGTTDDWAYAAMSAYGYTIEHGLLGFHPAYADEVGAFWSAHMKAFTVLFEMAANPKYHSVVTGRVAGGQAQLTLKKSFATVLSPGNPTGQEAVDEAIELNLTTNKDGSFEWHVTPSDRPYEKKPESYTLVIKSAAGTRSLKVHLERGQVLDLGTIKL
ncbi:MAG: hypothetical protein QOK47_277 [Actinomycetota bacterium]|nr:hypothetical protein [Actinomycetota bacterium]